jgi:predicted site-specific integrase-resolvase
MKNWIDSQIVLQTLKISPRTLQRPRDNGTLPYSRLGRKIFYKESDIEKVLTDNYVMFNIRNKDK